MFGSKTKVKLDEDLYRRCKKHAEDAGYSSVEEFINHALEKILMNEGSNNPEDQKKVIERLKGLGYIE